MLGAAEDFFDKSLREKYCDGMYVPVHEGLELAFFDTRIDVWFCRYCWSIICGIPA